MISDGDKVKTSRSAGEDINSGYGENSTTAVHAKTKEKMLYNINTQT